MKTLNKSKLCVCIALLSAGVSAMQAKDYRFSPSQTTELKQLLRNGTLQPGDCVTLQDGVYDSLDEVLILAKGMPNDSIILQAAHPGKTVISGKIHMRIDGRYLQISGLLFNKAWAKGGNMIEFRQGAGKESSHCRFTNCVIDDCNDPSKPEKAPAANEKISNATEYWLGLYGENNRIDHCYFANKRVGGLVLQVWLDKQSHLNNHWIDHNLFGCRTPYEGNGAEIIRIGHSWSSQLESHSIVENNIFFHCDGENEIISVKSCHNILRRNLFFESKGGLVCRHGHYNVIESNTFVGNGLKGSCGIRIINQGHTVYDNQLFRLGGFGLLVRMGIYERPTTGTDTTKEPLTSYHRVENVDIAYNQFADCQTMEFASGRGNKEPRNVRFAYNTIVNPKNNMRFFNPETTLFGFYFLENQYCFTDNEKLTLNGFTENKSLMQTNEKQRVLDCCIGIGPDWYSANNNDLEYIRRQYR